MSATAQPQLADARARVLIVDDEKGPRESLRIILSSNYDVVTAAGGGEALGILEQQEPFDVLTIDLNMPGMKGEELIRTVRERYPDTAVVVITGCGSLESAVQGIRSGVSDYLSKPFDVIQVTGAVSRALEQQQSRKRLVRFLEKVASVLGREQESGRAIANLEADRILQRRLRQLLGEPALVPTSTRSKLSAEGTIEFLEVLAQTIESRDVYMRGHARRVASYASLLCERLELPPEEREHVRISSFLHDLGKVGVPSDVLASAEELDSDGRRFMHAHAAIGERLVGPLGFSSAVGSAIRHHHERWDGTGYADALRGEEIPLASRMIAICDAFDAMTCDRPYSRKATRREAIVELRQHAGSQFDPSLVEIFIDIVERGECELGLVNEDLENSWIGDPS